MKHQKCKVKTCDILLHHSKGYCKRHYYQYLKHGFAREWDGFSKNEIIKHKNYAEIILRNKFHIPIGKTKIDLEDINNIKNYKWRLSNRRYVHTGTPNIMIHRLIMNTPKELFIDHINHDTVDNRKQNLRNVTLSQNFMNKNSSGVYYNKGSKIWEARLMKNGVNYIKGFKTYIQAKKHRNFLEEKHFKEFKYKR